LKPRDITTTWNTYILCKVDFSVKSVDALFREIPLSSQDLTSGNSEVNRRENYNKNKRQNNN